MNEKIRNIVFYNRWHNGDLFLPKAYMARLIRTLRQQSDYQIYFAHNNNSKLLCDLDVSFFSLNETEIPAHDGHTVFVEKDTLYINTWVGAYKGFFSELQEHCNVITIGQIWTSIYYTVQSILGIQIFAGYDQKFNPSAGIPTTDWSKYEIKPVEDFVLGKNNLILFCNGKVRSEQTKQSNIDVMSDSIQALAAMHSEYNFVCTEKFDIQLNVNNIFFTDDILVSVQGGDINEIAYLSTFCDIIVGKSSGPHMYCHVKDNTERDCIFFTINDRQSDDYLYNLYDMNCTHIFFAGTKEQKMRVALDRIMRNQLPYFKKSVITDDNLFEVKKTLDIRNY